MAHPLSASPILVAALALPMAAQGASPGKLPEGAPAAMASIDEPDLVRHASFLAADELGGRLTGSPGQLRAADYIAEHFASLGLEPLGDPLPASERTPGGPERSFFQRYAISRTFVEQESSGITAGGDTFREGYAILTEADLTLDLSGPLRFWGLGRVSGGRQDVPDGHSLAGEVALVLVRPPRGRIAKDLGVEQKFMMAFGTLGRLARTASNLQRRGAEAVVFVTTEDPLGLLDVLNYAAVAPGKDQLAPRFKGGAGDMAQVLAMVGGRNVDIPRVICAPALSARLLAALGIDAASLAAYLESGEPGDVPGATDVKGRLVLSVSTDRTAEAVNVVAVLPGGDAERAADAVVYSAHMDHVGRRMDGEVFNGADDNASGTSGLLEIAEAYARAEQPPARSIVFLSVSGEELGLWGSEYFAEHPTWPLDRVVANVNTDMIGRSGPESGPREVTVTPSYRHRAFSTIVRDAAVLGDELGLQFTIGDKYYERSDHYNFAEKGVPVVFFCNGEHEDYHQISDRAEKLDGQKMERIARLAFWTGWRVANATGRPRTLGRQPGWRE